MGPSSILQMTVGESTTLPAALVAAYPELARVRWRRGGLPVYVAGWCLGQRSAAAITLWNTVFLSPGLRLAPELLLHEFRHVEQFAASPAFPIRYLWESVRRGYFANRYEADARAFAARRLVGAD